MEEGKNMVLNQQQQSGADCPQPSNAQVQHASNRASFDSGLGLLSHTPPGVPAAVIDDLNISRESGEIQPVSGGHFQGVQRTD